MEKNWIVGWVLGVPAIVAITSYVLCTDKLLLNSHHLIAGYF